MIFTTYIERTTRAAGVEDAEEMFSASGPDGILAAVRRTAADWVRSKGSSDADRMTVNCLFVQPRPGRDRPSVMSVYCYCCRVAEADDPASAHRTWAAALLARRENEKNGNTFEDDTVMALADPLFAKFDVQIDEDPEPDDPFAEESGA